jgi:hypothetical protein
VHLCACEARYRFEGVFIGQIIGDKTLDAAARIQSAVVNRHFNCGFVSSSFDVVAGGMVLSEVVERLMMMSGSDASTCPAACGRAAASRLTEVVATTVPAGHRRLVRTEPGTSN